MRVFLLKARLLAPLGLFILSGCSAGSAAQLSLSTPAATSSATSTEATPTPLPVIPVHLVIPSIGVNTLIERVGVQANGELATPTQAPWEDVGWYAAGPRPGERGSAVIDGHLDRPGGQPAVFWRLRDLKIGDRALVTDSIGNTLHFQVLQLAWYPPQTAPLQEIFGNQGGFFLNFITCAGDWIPSQQQTNLRLVVYTILT